MSEYYFEKNSSLLKFPITTEQNLKLFFSRAGEFPENIIKEDSNETGIENDAYDIINNSTINNVNPALSLKKEEKNNENLLYHFSNIIKQNNLNSKLK